jgi:hypothetical protein
VGSEMCIRDSDMTDTKSTAGPTDLSSPKLGKV